MDRHQGEELQRAMVRLADGDRSAFRPVYEAIWPIVRRFAARSLGNAADADDVAQEALLRIFARASEFDTDRDVLPWALGIVAHECRTLRRRIERRRENLGAQEVSELAAAAPTPEGALVERELEAAAMEVLGTLGPQDVATILVATREAERPAIPAATFRKRLERATTRLRFAWRAKHGSE